MELLGYFNPPPGPPGIGSPITRPTAKGMIKVAISPALSIQYFLRSGVTFSPIQESV